MADGKTYEYSVVAQGRDCAALTSSQDSDKSNAARVTWRRTLPGAPTGLTVTLNADYQPALTWTKPTVDNYHSEPHGYQVSRSADGGTTYSDFPLRVNANPPSTSFTDTAMLTAGDYLYRVRAIRKRWPNGRDGDNIDNFVWDLGPWSATASVTLEPGNLLYIN